MKYRHLRFFRAAKDSKVWLQVASRMNSWGDADDEWRGLAPMSTHTVCFPTSYGIPNIFKAAQNNDIPDAQRRSVDQEEHAKVVAGMHAIKAAFQHFDDDNLADCLDLLSLYTAPASKFAWDPVDIQRLYGRGTGAGASAEVGAQQAQGLPVGQVGQKYLCMPHEDDDDTFLVGIIRAVTKNRDGENGVNMQWFSLPPGGNVCKYTSAYSAVLPSNTR